MINLSGDAINAKEIGMDNDKQTAIRTHQVWDAPVRWFHWINFICIVGLFFMGFMMLYKAELGITSVEAKIALKVIHVLIGYVFVINLLIRLLWAFVGNRHARWSALLPGKGTISEAAGYIRAVREGKPQPYLGHNPLGRMAVTLILLLLLTMAVTGLIRAGTDIYYPPLGSWVSTYIAAEGVDPATLKPYDETQVDPDRMKKVKEFKAPIGEIHVYTAYVLLGVIVLHILAVIVTDKREGGAIISAMFTGRKYLAGKPRDEGGNA